jgi:hypothetical protein
MPVMNNTNNSHHAEAEVDDEVEASGMVSGMSCNGHSVLFMKSR